MLGFAQLDALPDGAVFLEEEVHVHAHPARGDGPAQPADDAVEGAQAHEPRPEVAPAQKQVAQLVDYRQWLQRWCTSE